MKRIHLIISGDVQGVGYRAWVKEQAKYFRLTGWVRNREDRTVEAVFEGEEKSLILMIAACKKGPEVAWVKNVQITWKESLDEFQGVEIRR